MSGLKEIAVEIDGVRDLALVGNDDAVWLVVPTRWWDLSTLIFWLFVPSDKKARVKVTLTDGKTVGFRAVRVASRHVKVRGQAL